MQNGTANKTENKLNAFQQRIYGLIEQADERNPDVQQRQAAEAKLIELRVVDANGTWVDSSSSDITEVQNMFN